MSTLCTPFEYTSLSSASIPRALIAAMREPRSSTKTVFLGGQSPAGWRRSLYARAATATPADADITAARGREAAFPRRRSITASAFARLLIAPPCAERVVRRSPVSLSGRSVRCALATRRPAFETRPLAASVRDHGRRSGPRRTRRARGAALGPAHRSVPRRTTRRSGGYCGGPIRLSLPPTDSRPTTPGGMSRKAAHCRFSRKAGAPERDFEPLALATLWMQRAARSA